MASDLHIDRLSAQAKLEQSLVQSWNPTRPGFDNCQSFLSYLRQIKSGLRDRDIYRVLGRHWSFLTNQKQTKQNPKILPKPLFQANFGSRVTCWV